MFTSYIQQTIDILRKNGRHITANRYTTVLASFNRFLQNRQLHSPRLKDITPALIQAYEAYLRELQLSPNTTSFYLRNLRALYNRAVDDNLTPQCHPFKRVYTGIAPTVKRAITLDTIREIANLDLTQEPALDIARDMFILAFYLQGMSLIDLTFLTPGNLHGSYLHYRRHKTGQQLVIRWTAEMQAILDKYPDNPTGYLLPIITKPGKDPLKAYRNASCRINRNLHKIAMRLGITTVNLTHYVARHSWATAALSSGIPVGIISQGMGHESEKTTRIYLATLNTAPVDQANALIISRLKNKTGK